MQPMHRGSSHSSFLTPPLTPYSDGDVPFKPDSPDNISLNMKKRHHKKHTSTRPGYTKVDPFSFELHLASHDKGKAGSGIEADSSGQHRSQSLPVVSDRKPFQGLRPLSSKQANAEKSWGPRHRRWTLPSKAQPTRGVTIASSAAQHERSFQKSKRKASPAIITLRRATSNLRCDNGITFFPPPTFNSTRPNFLSTLLSTVAGDDRLTRQMNENEAASLQSPMPEASGRHPLLELDTQSKDNAAISPTFTQVNVESTRSLAVVADTARPRRCSTKYFSRSSVYEVIWDENNSPSRSDSNSVSSSGMERESDRRVRRPSAAVQQLETQMAQAMAQSRRDSIATAHRSPYENDLDTYQGSSFQALINSAFSRLTNESALRHVPRSKASSGSRLPPTQISLELPTSLMLCEGHATALQHGTDVFPPLVFDTQNDKQMLNADDSPKDFKQPQSLQALDRPRMGSLVGTSARKHRKTSTRRVSAPDRSNCNLLASHYSPRGSVTVRSKDEEAMPLLSTPTWNVTSQGEE